MPGKFHLSRNILLFLKKGYNVSHASTLKDGLAKLRATRPDILFLDNNLPDGDGWDAIEEIVEIIPQIRAYLVSAHRNKTTFTGTDENIVIWEKPISLHTLNAVF